MTETLRRSPCQTCSAPGFYTCDYPVAQRGSGLTRSCGRVLCRTHATPVAGVAHYCPAHERMSRGPATPNAADRPRVPGFED